MTAHLTHYLEGAELSATRAGAFVAGDIEPVKKMVLAETGSMYRVQPRSKVWDLMVFALGEIFTPCGSRWGPTWRSLCASSNECWPLRRKRRQWEPPVISGCPFA